MLNCRDMVSIKKWENLSNVFFCITLFSLLFVTMFSQNLINIHV